jgi:hypothetical protein
MHQLHLSAFGPGLERRADMLLVVLVLQGSHDLELGWVERGGDAVVDRRCAALDVKPLESAWSAEHKDMGREITFDDKRVGDAALERTA